MEIIEPKPTLYVPFSKNEFESKLAAINAGSKAYWADKAGNYCDPLIDVESTYWMVVLAEFESAFTETELAGAKPFKEIILPPVIQKS